MDDGESDIIIDTERRKRNAESTENEEDYEDETEYEKYEDEEYEYMDDFEYQTDSNGILVDYSRVL